MRRFYGTFMGHYGTRAFIYALFSILLIIGTSFAQIFPKPIPAQVNVSISCVNSACLIIANNGAPVGFNGNNSFQNFNVPTIIYINETECPSIQQFNQEVVIPLKNNLTVCQALGVLNQSTLLEFLNNHTLDSTQVINSSELDRVLSIHRFESTNQCQIFLAGNITEGVMQECNRQVENFSIISSNYTACQELLRTEKETFGAGLKICEDARDDAVDSLDRIGTSNIVIFIAVIIIGVIYFVYYFITKYREGG